MTFSIRKLMVLTVICAIASLMLASTFQKPTPTNRAVEALEALNLAKQLDQELKSRISTLCITQRQRAKILKPYQDLQKEFSLELSEQNHPVVWDSSGKCYVFEKHRN